MSVFHAIRNLFRTGAPAADVGQQYDHPGGSNSKSSAVVTFDSAMQVSAVWASVRLIAESIASLPFDIFETTSGERKPAKNLALRNLMVNKPNRYQTTVEFWEQVLLNLVVSGNAYVLIGKLGNDIISLIPVSTSVMTTELLADGTVIHRLTLSGETKIYAQSSVWHIKLFGNGIVGLSPLSYAASSIGIAIDSEQQAGRLFANGAKPAGVLTIDKTLSPEQRQQIRNTFKGLESGDESRLFVLEASMAYQQVSMTPLDIELLNSRRFQIEDIGRFFGVPSILLNQTFGQSSLGSNVYEILNAFYKLNLRPYMEKIEASVRRWLLDSSEQYECEFDFDALLRSDTLSRAQAYREMINSAQITPNESRFLEGRAPLEGGDRLFIQGAMIPIESAGQLPARGAANEPV